MHKEAEALLKGHRRCDLTAFPTNGHVTGPGYNNPSHWCLKIEHFSYLLGWSPLAR